MYNFYGYIALIVMIVPHFIKKKEHVYFINAFLLTGLISFNFYNYGIYLDETASLSSIIPFLLTIIAGVILLITFLRFLYKK